MFDLTIAQGPAAWLLTYALHSTLFLSLAWLVSRLLAQRMPALEEAVWRFALVAGLITASLQMAVGREPLSGSWRLASSESAAVSAPVARELEAMVSSRPRAARMAALPARTEAPASSASDSSFPFSLPVALAGVWLAGALLLASSWLTGALRLRRRLRPRPQVVEATMVSLLGELRERAGLRQPVRLTCSSRLPVPVALGLRRPEICVPPRALASLAPEQQEGMLAHELAHLVRRDPFWLAFGRVLSSILFFQPLNWIAVRRLRELSELLCDEWAVGRTGRPVSLARCLTEVAGWSLPKALPLRSLPVPGMADRPSNLARRIRRLLENARSPQRRVHPAWLGAGMLLLVIAVAAAAPGVQAAVGGEEVPVPEVAVEAPVAEGARAPRPDEPDLAELDEDLDDLAALDAADSMDHLDELDELDELNDLANDLSEDLSGDLADDIADSLEDELDRSLEGLGESTWQIAGDVYGLHMEAARDAAQAERELSEAEAEEIERHYEAVAEEMSRRVEEQIEPRMEELEKLIEQHSARFEKSEEMRELTRRAEEIAQRARPSEVEMLKLQAEVEKMRAEGGLTAEEKKKIREEAQRVAREHRLSDKDRAEIDAIRKQARELAQRSMREQQPELEKMRREILEESRAMREEVQRQLENDPKLRELRERRQKERESQREEMRERREEMREDRERAPRAPRAPRPERHVSVHVAPEAPAPRPTAHLKPAIAPVALPAPVPSPTPVAAPEPPGR